MPNTLNYASIWSPSILEVITQNTLTAPFMASNVEFLKGKTFHFTQLSVSGYKNHSRDGGWNRGNIAESDKTFTCEHDRDIEFLIDRADVLETNETASAQNVSTVFAKTQQAPETDAYFFERVVAAAVAASRTSSTALSAWTKTNVLEKLQAIIRPCKKYKAYAGGLVAYVRSEIMDLLAICPDFGRKIDVQNVGPEGASVQTRIVSIDGVTLIEVLNEERFMTAFDYADGFKAKTTAKAINVLVASPMTVKTVQKVESIYFFAPGTHTEGDGYLYQNRSFWDTFVFPNGSDGKIDSVFADIQP